MREFFAIIAGLGALVVVLGVIVNINEIRTKVDLLCKKMGIEEGEE